MQGQLVKNVKKIIILLVFANTRLKAAVLLKYNRNRRIDDVRGISIGERCFGTRPIELRVHNQKALAGKTAHVVNAAEYRLLSGFYFYQQPCEQQEKITEQTLNH